MRLPWRKPSPLTDTVGLRSGFGSQRLGPSAAPALSDRLCRVEAERDACLSFLSGTTPEQIAAEHPDLADFAGQLRAVQARSGTLQGTDSQMKALERDCEAIAAGQLRPLSSEARTPGPARRLSDLIQTAIQHWGNAIGSAMRRSSEAAGSAADLAARSNLLRDRTAAQIDLVQGVTFSLDVVSELAQNNSQLATRSCELAGQTQAATQDMEQGLAGLNDAMRRIGDTSRQITGVVLRIEDIAFQTNMLALNAGIQAAQAGEAGRGFAVVAAEVRVLAGATKELAESITAMSQESLAALIGAERHSHEADDQMARIVRMSREVLGLLQQVQAISDRQASQVNELLQSVKSTTESAAETARLAALSRDVLLRHDTVLQALESSLALVSVDDRLREQDGMVPAPLPQVAAAGGGSIELF